MSLIEDCAGLAGAEPQTWGTSLMNATIFVGLDVHKETVAEGRRGGEVLQLGNFLNRPDPIEKLVERLAKGNRTLSFCYEAGPCGYGLFRQLVALGHDCVVAAPSLIPMKAGDRVKTDRRDAVMLAELHRAGGPRQGLVHDRADHAQRMIPPNSSFKIDVAKQRPRPFVLASHDSIPRPTQKQNHKAIPVATDFFNSLLSCSLSMGCARLFALASPRRSCCHAHGRRRGLRRRLSKLSCAGWLPHDRGFVLGCLSLGASVDRAGS
jgi:hypothetical protein